LASAGPGIRIDAAVVRACHFHEKLGLRLDAYSFRRRWPSVSNGIDRDFRNGQKHSDHAPLLAELRD
jgi:exonuclease III